MEWTQEKLAEVITELQKKAMADEAFREELLADPEKAIETLTGKKPPEGFRLKVVEHDPAYTATMILPALSERELTDEEVDAVSGGGDRISLWHYSRDCSYLVNPDPKFDRYASRLDQ